MKATYVVIGGDLNIASEKLSGQDFAASSRTPFSPGRFGRLLGMVEGAVAVVWHQGNVLVQQRKGTNHLDGYWEFPGGKIEAGETPREAVCRELEEEVGLRIAPEAPEFLFTQDYPYPERHVRLHFFLCRLPVSFTPPHGLWISAAKLDRFAFPPANAKILDRLKTLEDAEKSPEGAEENSLGRKPQVPVRKTD